MNENLRRALLRARLTEADVAARLEVDPKTVRRWLEGRVPYLRHRWAIAGMLGVDETDLWPELRAALAARSRPPEIQAIYPSRAAIPRDLWHRLFASAEREIAILDDSCFLLAAESGVPRLLASKAQTGVSVRICLASPRRPDNAQPGDADAPGDIAAEIRDAPVRCQPLREARGVRIRVYHASLYSSIYRADSQVVVGQRASGIPAVRAPVLHLTTAGDTGMALAYLGSFERIWAKARPPD